MFRVGARGNAASKTARTEFPQANKEHGPAPMVGQTTRLTEESEALLPHVVQWRERSCANAKRAPWRHCRCSESSFLPEAEGTGPVPVSRGDACSTHCSAPLLKSILYFDRVVRVRWCSACCSNGVGGLPRRGETKNPVQSERRGSVVQSMLGRRRGCSLGECSSRIAAFIGCRRVGPSRGSCCACHSASLGRVYRGAAGVRFPLALMGRRSECVGRSCLQTDGPLGRAWSRADFARRGRKEGAVTCDELRSFFFFTPQRLNTYAVGLAHGD